MKINYEIIFVGDDCHKWSPTTTFYGRLLSANHHKCLMDVISGNHCSKVIDVTFITYLKIQNGAWLTLPMVTWVASGTVRNSNLIKKNTSLQTPMREAIIYLRNCYLHLTFKIWYILKLY